jgi:hypothetical protein
MHVEFRFVPQYFVQPIDDDPRHAKIEALIDGGRCDVVLMDKNCGARWMLWQQTEQKSFEKKNRSVNEPIFFYTGGSHAALELVVNKVTKTTASGYVSVPKAAGASSASASSSGQ